VKLMEGRATAARPFFLPLFTEVPRRWILGSSSSKDTQIGRKSKLKKAALGSEPRAGPPRSSPLLPASLYTSERGTHLRKHSGTRDDVFAVHDDVDLILDVTIDVGHKREGYTSSQTLGTTFSQFTTTSTSFWV
jgi:hypothetical protein